MKVMVPVSLLSLFLSGIFNAPVPQPRANPEPFLLPILIPLLLPALSHVIAGSTTGAPTVIKDQKVLKDFIMEEKDIDYQRIRKDVISLLEALKEEYDSDENITEQYLTALELN